MKDIYKIPVYNLDRGVAHLVKEIEKLLSEQEVVVVAVGGGWASGKTSAVAEVPRKAFDKISLLYSTDDYYFGLPYMEEQNAKGIDINWDQPEAVNLQLFFRQLAELKSGKPIKKPVYNFKTGKSDGFEVLQPRRLIIVEGLFVLDEAINPIADIKVFVDISTHGRILRRILRDVDRTGQAPPVILKQIVDTAYPMHNKYVEVTKQNADFIVDNEWNPQTEAQRAKHREVQLKFPIIIDGKYLEFLRKIGAERLGTVFQTDIYYNPDGLDLAESGEALRIREEGDYLELTYKGPKIESPYRERPKLEFEIDRDTKHKFLKIYGSQVKTIVKERILYQLDGIVFSLDKVKKIEGYAITGVGEFIEIRAIRKDASRLELDDVLKTLGLDIDQGIKKSYVELKCND